MAARVIGIPEFAEMVGRSVETIRDWHRVGYGPTGHKYGRRVGFLLDEVEAFICDPAEFEQEKARKIMREDGKRCG